MIYMLDTANLEDIKRAYDLYPITGVTTNPTIISKEKRDLIEILKDIREIIGKETMLHAQVLGVKAEEMIREAHYLQETIGGNFYVKIPVTKEGIKAMKILSKEGINITATAIFTAQQALMAATSGAKFVAPYVNRIDNISANGVQVVSDIIDELRAYKLDCKVLAASFKNVQQVHELSKLGVCSITVNPEIMDKMIEHPLTDWSVDQFINDWEKVFGKNTLL